MLKRSAPIKRTALRRETGEARLTVKLSERECEVCSKVFQQRTTMQSLCGKRCLFKKLREAEKAERELDKARREKLMTLSDWKKKAQEVFNLFIRTRDAGLPCICCGQPFEPEKPGGSVDAGHFRSRGSAPHLALVEDNCFAQRKNCNRPGGTTYAKFRAGVVARIGEERTAAVEADQAVRKYTAADYQELIAEYRAKTRALKARQ